jgi:carbon monoxide dehydrogenase subunit G
VFTQGTILIDRPVAEIYDFVADLRSQLRCWDILNVPGLSELPENSLNASGSCRMGNVVYDCIVELHLTRPGAGVVTRVSWSNGELAAEWRIMEDGDRTRIELNVEGQGGGLASPVHLRPMAQRILTRLKQQFDMA